MEQQLLWSLLVEQLRPRQRRLVWRPLQHQLELELIELVLGPLLRLGPVPRFRLALRQIIIKVLRLLGRQGSLVVLLKRSLRWTLVLLLMPQPEPVLVQALQLKELLLVMLLIKMLLLELKPGPELPFPE